MKMWEVNDDIFYQKETVESLAQVNLKDLYIRYKEEFFNKNGHHHGISDYHWPKLRYLHPSTSHIYKNCLQIDMK